MSFKTNHKHPKTNLWWVEKVSDAFFFFKKVETKTSSNDENKQLTLKDEAISLMQKIRHLTSGWGSTLKFLTAILETSSHKGSHKLDVYKEFFNQVMKVYIKKKRGLLETRGFSTENVWHVQVHTYLLTFQGFWVLVLWMPAWLTAHTDPSKMLFDTPVLLQLN